MGFPRMCDSRWNQGESCATGTLLPVEHRSAWAQLCTRPVCLLLDLSRFLWKTFLLLPSWSFPRLGSFRRIKIIGCFYPPLSWCMFSKESAHPFHSGAILSKFWEKVPYRFSSMEGGPWPKHFVISTHHLGLGKSSQDIKAWPLAGTQWFQLHLDHMCMGGGGVSGSALSPQ